MNAVFRDGDDFVRFVPGKINHGTRFVVTQGAVGFFGESTSVFGDLGPFLVVVRLVGVGPGGFDGLFIGGHLSSDSFGSVGLVETAVDVVAVGGGSSFDGMASMSVFSMGYKNNEATIEATTRGEQWMCWTVGVPVYTQLPLMLYVGKTVSYGK